MARFFKNISNLRNIWFATIWTTDKKPIFQDTTISQVFHLFLLDLKFSKIFKIYGWVILPDHAHILIQTKNIVEFLKYLHGELNDFYSTYREDFHAQNLFNKPQITLVNSEENFYKYFHTLHSDPVSHGYVDDLIDYPFSSYHEYLKSYGIKFDKYFRKK